MKILLELYMEPKNGSSWLRSRHRKDQPIGVLKYDVFPIEGMTSNSSVLEEFMKTESCGSVLCSELQLVYE